MKHAANAISAGRIVILAALFFVWGDRPLFVALYLLAGLTDVLDGYVARRTHTQSRLGARLDSIADILLFAAVLAVLFLWAGEAVYAFIPWVAATALVRVLNLVISAVKYREAVFLHTWGNKLAGLLIFLSPLVYAATERAALLWPACVLALLSALEEGLVHLTAPVPDPDRKSLFSKPGDSSGA